MDFDDLTPDEVAFRDEVRHFFETKLTPELHEAGDKTVSAISQFEYGRQWQRILFEKGWGAPNWPVEHGGTGWSTMQKMIWASESSHFHPPIVMNMGRDLCAPCIMAFGSDEQKATLLPRIIAGEDWWAQGYSEPGAGSDLASLQLSAVADGDDYVLNGSKIWTTLAHHASKIFCLVRTSREERKQSGITFLLIDMATPGIEVRPIRDLAGRHEFNQVYFTNVRTPQSSRLGEEGQGWTVARHLLTIEHSGSVFDGIEMRRRLNWLAEIAAEEPDGRGGRLLDDPDFERHYVAAAIDCEASDAMTARLIKQIRQGGVAPGLTELLNIRRRELAQHLTELLMRATGRDALVYQDAALEVGGTAAVGPDRAVLPMAFFLAQRASTIAGGTSEIHRNNVARHVLGL